MVAKVQEHGAVIRVTQKMRISSQQMEYILEAIPHILQFPPDLSGLWAMKPQEMNPSRCSKDCLKS